jgi:hypothetical protein
MNKTGFSLIRKHRTEEGRCLHYYYRRTELQTRLTIEEETDWANQFNSWKNEGKALLAAQIEHRDRATELDREQQRPNLAW